MDVLVGGERHHGEGPGGQAEARGEYFAKYENKTGAENACYETYDHSFISFFNQILTLDWGGSTLSWGR